MSLSVFCRCGQHPTAEANGREGLPAIVQHDRHGQRPFSPPTVRTCAWTPHATPYHLGRLRNVCHERPQSLRPTFPTIAGSTATLSGHVLSPVHGPLLLRHCPLSLTLTLLLRLFPVLLTLLLGQTHGSSHGTRLIHVWRPTRSLLPATSTQHPPLRTTIDFSE